MESKYEFQCHTPVNNANAAKTGFERVKLDRNISDIHSLRQSWQIHLWIQVFL